MEGPLHHLFDKRIQKPIVYRVKNLGEDVTTQEIFTFKVGKCYLRFDKPNSTSIFLSSSDKELLKAKEIYKSLVLPKITKRERFQLSEEDTIQLYDYIEHIQTSIVMAFTAVECLANELVPQGYVFNQKIKNGELKEWKKNDIERWMSTIDKITLVIPRILNISNPTTYKFWPKFTKLRDLRNDIIHSNSKLPIEVKENERVFSLLLNESVFGKIKSASELINKIHSEIPPHKAMPIIKDTETIDAIDIPSWDSLGVTKID